MARYIRRHCMGDGVIWVAEDLPKVWVSCLDNGHRPENEPVGDALPSKFTKGYRGRGVLIGRKSRYTWRFVSLLPCFSFSFPCMYCSTCVCTVETVLAKRKTLKRRNVL